MSIDHKAYLFDHTAFERQLAPVLSEALETGCVEPLRRFILRHGDQLTDPDTEEPLDEDWEASAAEEDGVQWYADRALTLFYDLAGGSEGLGQGYDALHAYLRTIPLLRDEADTLLFGRLFGPPGRRLDPGFMGTGLVSEKEVRRLHRLLEECDFPPVPGPGSPLYAGCLYPPEEEGEVEEALDSLSELYAEAADEGRGLLFTDFSGSGVSHL